jgi:Type ISP C-terminal specificity domain
MSTLLSLARRTPHQNRNATDEKPPEAFRYRLGNRSALEWVIDQYRVTEDGRKRIRSSMACGVEARGRGGIRYPGSGRIG